MGDWIPDRRLLRCRRRIGRYFWLIGVWNREDGGNGWNSRLAVRPIFARIFHASRTAFDRAARWIFIIEGAISAGVGLLCYVLIVDFPEKGNYIFTPFSNLHRLTHMNPAARKNWLARLFGLQAFLTPEEVAIVLARIEHDRGDAVEEEKLTRKLFFTYLQDWKVWEFPLYLMLNVRNLPTLTIVTNSH